MYYILWMSLMCWYPLAGTMRLAFVYTENVTVLYRMHTPSTVLLILRLGNKPAISSYVHVNPC